MKRLSRPIKVTLFLLPVLCGMGYVQARGGITEVLRLPASLDSSTPAEQNGYTLLGIQRGPDCTYKGPDSGQDGAYIVQEAQCVPDGIGIWIKEDIPPSAPKVTVAGRASNGDTFPLRAEKQSAMDPYLLVRIAPGYPD